MVQIVLMGLGAGAAAALLFASVTSGVVVSVFLFYLAPLPIMIAALGWSHWAGLAAAVFAAAILGGLFGIFFFGTFLATIGRAGVVARLSGAARPPGPERRRRAWSGIRSGAWCCGPRCSAPRWSPPRW